MKAITSIAVTQSVNIFDFDDDRDAAISKAKDACIGGVAASAKLGDEIAYSVNDNAVEHVELAPSKFLGINGDNVEWLISISGESELVNRISDIICVEE